MLKHHIVIVVVVEHGDRGETDGDAAGLWRVLWIQGMHQGLQDGMVGAVQALTERERTLPVAVVGHEALRGDYPVLPADIFKTDVEAASFTHIAGCHGDVDGASPLSGPTPIWVEGHSH